MKAPKISSSYAIIDVEKGRKALEKYLRENGKLRVTIEAVLTDPFGSDDGTSIEFNADVLSIEVRP